MTPTPKGVDQRPLSGPFRASLQGEPARAGMTWRSSVSVPLDCARGTLSLPKGRFHPALRDYSRCCPSGSGNVSLGRLMSHTFLRHVRSPEVNAYAAQAVGEIARPHPPLPPAVDGVRASFFQGLRPVGRAVESGNYELSHLFSIICVEFLSSF